MASRVREAALCVDNMKSQKIESRIQNLESRRSTLAGVTGTVAPSKGGKRRSRIVLFSRIMARVSHLFPLDFFRAHKISGKGMNQGIGQGIVRPRQSRTGLALFRGLSPTAIHVQATSWLGKVRKSSNNYAKFHESSHRSGPWLRDCSDKFGWDQFFNK